MIDLHIVVGTVAIIGLAIDQGQIGNTLLENIVVIQLHYRKIIRSDAVHVHTSGATYIFHKSQYIRAVGIGQGIGCGCGVGACLHLRCELAFKSIQITHIQITLVNQGNVVNFQFAGSGD